MGVSGAVAARAGKRLSDGAVDGNVRRRSKDVAGGAAVPDSVSVFGQKQPRLDFTGDYAVHNNA